MLPSAMCIHGVRLLLFASISVRRFVCRPDERGERAVSRFVGPARAFSNRREKYLMRADPRRERVPRLYSFPRSFLITPGHSFSFPPTLPPCSCYGWRGLTRIFMPALRLRGVSVVQNCLFSSGPTTRMCDAGDGVRPWSLRG